jgi:hypothetical protein
MRARERLLEGRSVVHVARDEREAVVGGLMVGQEFLRLGGVGVSRETADVPETSVWCRGVQQRANNATSLIACGSNDDDYRVRGVGGRHFSFCRLLQGVARFADKKNVINRTPKVFWCRAEDVTWRKSGVPTSLIKLAPVR